MNINNEVSKIKDTDEKWGTYATGLTFGIVTILLCIGLLYYVNSEFVNNNTSIITIVSILVCIAIFAARIKTVHQKHLGYIVNTGSRNFKEYYPEGFWWIPPFCTFQQIPNYNVVNPNEKITVSTYSADNVAIYIDVSYYWQTVNIEIFENHPKDIIEKYIQERLRNYVVEKHTIEIFADKNIGKNLINTFISELKDEPGIKISNIFVTDIRYDPSYRTAIEKYNENLLHLKLYEIIYLDIPQKESQNFTNQVIDMIERTGIPKNEAYHYLLIFKEKIKKEINEKNYTFDTGEKMLNALNIIITLFKSKQ